MGPIIQRRGTTVSNGKRAFGTIEERGSGNYAVRFTWGDRRIKRRAGTSRRRAAALLRKAQVMRDDGATLEDILRAVFDDQPEAGRTFDGIVTGYLAAAEGRKKASTLARDRVRLATIVSEASWARSDLASIDTPTLQEWIEKMRAEGTAPTTCNRYLSMVSAVLEWARRMGYIEGNVARGVQRYGEAGRGREVYLADKQDEAAERACGDALRPFYVLAVETGLRKGEALRLTWGDVNLKERTLRVQSAYSKTSKARTVPLTSRTAKALKGLQRGVKAVPVFRFTEQDIRREWDAVREAVPELAAVRWHDLRHTAASRMVAAGISIFDVAKILGHANIQMTMRYAHFAPEALNGIAKRLDAARAG